MSAGSGGGASLLGAGRFEDAPGHQDGLAETRHIDHVCGRPELLDLVAVGLGLRLVTLLGEDGLEVGQFLDPFLLDLLHDQGIDPAGIQDLVQASVWGRGVHHGNGLDGSHCPLGS